MPNGMEGWAALGEMAGGGIGTPGVYEDTLKQAYSAEKALQDARRAKSQALIDAVRLERRQAVTPELVQSALGGDIAAQAALGSSVLGSNTTMNLGQLGEYQRPHYGENINAAQAALESGDAAGYNRFNAAALGEEYQPVQVLGGAYVPDGMTMDAIHAVPTPEVLSRIGENEAQAQAALIRANKPAAPRAPSASASEAQVLAQARERVAAGADPAQVAQYLVSKGYPNVAAKLHKPDR